MQLFNEMSYIIQKPYCDTCSWFDRIILKKKKEIDVLSFNFMKEIKPQMDMKTDPTAVITAGLTEESDDEFGVERATEDIDEGEVYFKVLVNVIK